MNRKPCKYGYPIKIAFHLGLCGMKVLKFRETEATSQPLNVKVGLLTIELLI